MVLGFLTEQWTELFKDFLKLRMRKPYTREIYRVWVQLLLVVVLCYLAIWIMAMPLVVETPWFLPFRIFQDTFGPFSRLWHFEPVLLERSRFEQPDNLWAKLTWPSASRLGRCQDMGFDYWNWIMLGIINGPWKQRFKVAAAFWCTVLVLFSFVGLIHTAFHKYAYMLEPTLMSVGKRVYSVWANWIPERFLILEQLFMCKSMGRKLSAATEQALTEYEELEMAEAAAEPRADMLGQAAEADESGVRQR